MKRAQMTSWLHNCTRLIKMADIMLLSTCIQKTELWLTFQQCCCLWYWEMALALSLFNSITLKQCRALIVPIGLAGKGMKRFFYFFYFSRICSDNFKCSNLNENPKLSHEITPCSKVIWGFDGRGKISEQRFKEISLSHFLQCFFLGEGDLTNTALIRAHNVWFFDVTVTAVSLWEVFDSGCRRLRALTTTSTPFFILLTDIDLCH